MADSKSSRVAIKFGRTSTSGPLSNGRPKPPSSLGKRHRARAMHDESDSDAEDAIDGRVEEITGYGPSGAWNDDRKRRNRRDRSLSYEERRRSTSRSRHRDRKDRREEELARRNGGAKDAAPTEEVKPVQYGLTINKKSDRGSTNRKEAASGRRNHDRSDLERDEREHAHRGPKTADEEALDALLEDEPRKQASETGGSRDDYRSLPIEDFGASLLRNLGWDGKMKGKPIEPRKHGNLTGLGSKSAKEAEDLGAWEQKKPKSRRLDDYQREEESRRRRRDERHGESSYKRERERERERDRERYRERR